MSDPRSQNSSNEQEPDLLDCASELIAVALETPFRELRDAPRRVQQILSDRRIYNAINNAFRQRALSLFQAQQTLQTRWVTDAEAQQAHQTQNERLGEVGDIALRALRQSAQRHITQGAAVQRLQRHANRCVETFNRSPVGIWIDENSGVVYVLGAVATIAGAAGIWWSRSNLLGQVVELGSAAIPAIPIGSAQLRAEIVHFEPANERIGARLNFNRNAQPLSFDWSLSGIWDDGTVRAGSEGQITIRPNQRLALGLNGAFNIEHNTNFDSARPGSIGMLDNPAQSATQISYRLGTQLTMNTDGLNISVLAYLNHSGQTTHYLRNLSVFEPGVGSLQGELDGLTGGLGIRLRRTRHQIMNFDVGAFAETNGADVRGGVQLQLEF